MWRRSVSIKAHLAEIVQSLARLLAGKGSCPPCELFLGQAELEHYCRVARLAEATRPGPRAVLATSAERCVGGEFELLAVRLAAAGRIRAGGHQARAGVLR